MMNNSAILHCLQVGPGSQGGGGRTGQYQPGGGAVLLSTYGNALNDYLVQTYLDWDPSSYPVLKTMRQNIDMYSTLWHTALDFHENYEKWYSGPVSQLDADSIRVKVEQAKYQI